MTVVPASPASVLTRLESHGRAEVWVEKTFRLPPVPPGCTDTTVIVVDQFRAPSLHLQVDPCRPWLVTFLRYPEATLRLADSRISKRRHAVSVLRSVKSIPS